MIIPSDNCFISFISSYNCSFNKNFIGELSISNFFKIICLNVPNFNYFSILNIIFIFSRSSLNYKPLKSTWTALNSSYWIDLFLFLKNIHFIPLFIIWKKNFLDLQFFSFHFPNKFENNLCLSICQLSFLDFQ
jgi:hypothetical protein